MNDQTKPKPVRDERGRVLPGHSLNPTGRAPMPVEVREAIGRIGPVAMRRMEQLLEPRRFLKMEPKDQIKLIEVALNRSFGKPVDAEPKRLQVEGNVEHEHTVSVSINRIVEKLDELPEFKNASRATDVEDAEEVED